MKLRMQLRQPPPKQLGFSVIEALLIVLVVAALAVTGFLVNQHHKPSSTKSSAATSQTQTTTQPAQTTTHYLEIKEWGIKLPLSDSIKDAYYAVSTSFSNDPDGLPSGVWLGLKSLNDPSCNPANNNTGGGTGAIGDILRVPQNATDPVSGKLYSQKYPNGVTINGYYFGYQSWINDTSCTQRSTAQAANLAFATAVKSIVSTTATQYLTIKEWGVRAPYSGSLKLSYKMSPDKRTATFSSDQLTALSSDCVGYGGAIVRYLPTDYASVYQQGPTVEQTATQTPSLYKHVGNYYYIFRHAQSGCGNVDSTAATASQTNDAVKALVPNLQAIPN